MLVTLLLQLLILVLLINNSLMVVPRAVFTAVRRGLDESVSR
jgi:hypothetical protein